MPSSVTFTMEARKPLTVVAPRPLETPGCVRKRLLTWRSSTGRFATCCCVTVVEFSMLTVCTVWLSAVTSTLCSTARISSLMAARTVSRAAFTTTPREVNFAKPAFSTARS